MNLTLNILAEGTIGFARRVSSEADYDFLRFLIDDVEVESWSGEVAWGEVSYPVPAGLHKLTWSYEKDEVGIGGSDHAWVDDIVLPPYEVVVGTHNPTLGSAAHGS